MEKEKIERINFLARKAKAEGLTAEEKEEQQLLRNEYREGFRRDLSAQLDNTYIIDKDGNKSKLGKKENKGKD